MDIVKGLRELAESNVLGDIAANEIESLRKQLASEKESHEAWENEHLREAAEKQKLFTKKENIYVDKLNELLRRLEESQAREKAMLDFIATEIKAWVDTEKWSRSPTIQDDWMADFAVQRITAFNKILVIPADDTALRQANEAYLNASPEMQLLNTIGGFLEDVEYTGSYLHGIIAYGKQAKKEALLEAADDCGASAWQTLWNVVLPLSRTGILIGSTAEAIVTRLARSVAVVKPTGYVNP